MILHPRFDEKRFDSFGMRFDFEMIFVDRDALDHGLHQPAAFGRTHDFPYAIKVFQNLLQFACRQRHIAVIQQPCQHGRGLKQHPDFLQYQFFKSIRRDPLDRTSTEIAFAVLQEKIVPIALFMVFDRMLQRHCSAARSAIEQSGKRIYFHRPPGIVMVHILFFSIV